MYALDAATGSDPLAVSPPAARSTPPRRSSTDPSTGAPATRSRRRAAATTSSTPSASAASSDTTAADDDDRAQPEPHRTARTAGTGARSASSVERDRQRRRRRRVPDALRSSIRQRAPASFAGSARRGVRARERHRRRNAHDLRGERGQGQQRREPGRQRARSRSTRPRPTITAAATTAAERERLVQRRRRRALHVHRRRLGDPGRRLPGRPDPRAASASRSPRRAATVTDAAGNTSAPSNVVTVKIVNPAGLCGRSDRPSYCWAEQVRQVGGRLQGHRRDVGPSRLRSARLGRAGTQPDPETACSRDIDDAGRPGAPGAGLADRVAGEQPRHSRRGGL